MTDDKPLFTLFVPKSCPIFWAVRFWFEHRFAYIDVHYWRYDWEHHAALIFER